MSDCLALSPCLISFQTDYSTKMYFTYLFKYRVFTKGNSSRNHLKSIWALVLQKPLLQRWRAQKGRARSEGWGPGLAESSASPEAALRAGAESEPEARQARRPREPCSLLMSLPCHLPRPPCGPPHSSLPQLTRLETERRPGARSGEASLPWARGSRRAPPRLARTLPGTADAASGPCLLPCRLLFRRQVVSESSWPHRLPHARLPECAGSTFIGRPCLKLSRFACCPLLLPSVFPFGFRVY